MKPDGQTADVELDSNRWGILCKDAAFALRHMRKYPLSMFALAMCIATSVLAQIFGPLALRQLINEVTSGHGGASVGLLVLYSSIAALGIAIVVVEQWQASRLAWSVSDDLRDEMFTHALQLPFGEQAKLTPGVMVERIDGDARLLGNLLSRFPIQVLAQGALVIATGIALSVVLPMAGLALGAVALLAGLVLIRVSRTARRAYAGLRNEQTAFSARIEEIIYGADDVDHVGGRSWALDRAERGLARLRGLDIGSSVLGSSIPWAAASFFASLALAGCIAILGAQLGNGGIGLGDAFLVFAYSQQLMNPLNQLAVQFQDLQSSSASLKRIRDFLAGSRSPASLEAEYVPATAPDVVLSHVCFSYENKRAVLSDASATIPGGSVVALVGPSGAGKTTVARLLMGLIQPQDGEIYAGGVRLDGRSSVELRSTVMLVTQESEMLPGTVLDNIQFWDKSIQRAAVEEAAEGSGLLELLLQIPGGLDASVGEGGNPLSPPQEQAIATLRAVVRSPRLLILDEATSKLDDRYEQQLYQALRRMVGTTTLVIAHRPETAVSCDFTLVLRDGRLSILMDGGADVGSFT